MLLSAASCGVDVADYDQTTPLIMAAIQGNVDICELLVSSLSLCVCVCVCVHAHMCVVYIWVCALMCYVFVCVHMCVSV